MVGWIEIGNVQRYKARLLARGFRRKPESTIKKHLVPWFVFSLRIRLTIATQEKIIIQQSAVKMASFYGDIEETICIKQPVGYEDGTNRVCKLKRNLYGFKQ